MKGQKSPCDHFYSVRSHRSVILSAFKHLLFDGEWRFTVSSNCRLGRLSLCRLDLILVLIISQNAFQLNLLHSAVSGESNNGSNSRACTFYSTSFGAAVMWTLDFQHTKYWLPFSLLYSAQIVFWCQNKTFYNYFCSCVRNIYNVYKTITFLTRHQSICDTSQIYLSYWYLSGVSD